MFARRSIGVITLNAAQPWGPGQQAPLTAEYQKVLEDSMADQDARQSVGHTARGDGNAGGHERQRG